MLAMTLPPPNKEGGVDQAANLNLALEYYFPDQVLCGIDRRSGGKLFSQSQYVHLGKHEEILDEFRDKILSTMKFRLLLQDGKKFLVDNLASLNDEDFRTFHGLFEIILSHLLPNHGLIIRPSIQKMMAEQEALTTK